MAVRNETGIADAIPVDTIIDVYSVTMTPYSLLYENPLVVYDYWQMIYVDRAKTPQRSNLCGSSFEGCPCCYLTMNA